MSAHTWSGVQWTADGRCTREPRRQRGMIPSVPSRPARAHALRSHTRNTCKHHLYIQWILKRLDVNRRTGARSTAAHLLRWAGTWWNEGTPSTKTASLLSTETKAGSGEEWRRQSMFKGRPPPSSSGGSATPFPPSTVSCCRLLTTRLPFWFSGSELWQHLTVYLLADSCHLGQLRTTEEGGQSYSKSYWLYAFQLSRR